MPHDETGVVTFMFPIGSRKASASGVNGNTRLVYVSHRE